MAPYGPNFTGADGSVFSEAGVNKSFKSRFKN